MGFLIAVLLAMIPIGLLAFVVYQSGSKLHGGVFVFILFVYGFILLGILEATGFEPNQGTVIAATVLVLSGFSFWNLLTKGRQDSETTNDSQNASGTHFQPKPTPPKPPSPPQPNPMSSKPLSSDPVPPAEEDNFYIQINEELESGKYSTPAKIKALSKADDTDHSFKKHYIRFRFDELKRQFIEENSLKGPFSEEAFKRHIEDLQDERPMDTDLIPSDKFDGVLEDLAYPMPIVEVASLSGMLQFEIVDLIKLEKLKGVRVDGEWYVDRVHVTPNT